MEHDRGGASSRLSNEQAAEAIFARLRVAPSPMAVVQIRVLGGAMARVAADATAFAHRDRRLMVAFGAFYEPSDEAAVHEESVAGSLAALPRTRGVPVGFLGDEGDARVHQAHPDDTHRRLATTKRRWDPTNLFSANRNIAP